MNGAGHHPPHQAWTRVQVHLILTPRGGAHAGPLLAAAAPAAMCDLRKPVSALNVVAKKDGGGWGGEGRLALRTPLQWTDRGRARAVPDRVGQMAQLQEEGWLVGPLPWAQRTTGLQLEAADSLGFAEQDCSRWCHPQGAHLPHS